VDVSLLQPRLIAGKVVYGEPGDLFSLLSESEKRVFGKYFRMARKFRGLTLQEAAELIGISVDGLSRIERDVNGATLGTLKLMADVYGVEIGDLLPHSQRDEGLEELRPILKALEGLGDETRETLLKLLTDQAESLKAVIKKEENPIAASERRSVGRPRRIQ
jgi:transcriptional regulator with XRE-family HTH domain